MTNLSPSAIIYLSRVFLHRGSAMKKGILILSLLLITLFIYGCNGECAHEGLSQTVVAPTCDQPGYTLHRCADCSLQFQTDLVPPTGHTETLHMVAASCEEGGYTEVTCTVCKISYKTDTTLPLGHIFTDEVTAPTCTEAGYTTRTCTRCAFSYKDHPVPPIAHELTETVIAPTCTEEGYTRQDCKLCDFSLKSHLVSPTGHQYTSVITHPTRQQSGKIVYTCHCDHSYTNHLFYSDIFPGAAVTENQTVLAKGVDVSLWQHFVRSDGSYAPLNWGAIRDAGFEFAILKAGSTPRGSLGGMDPVFEMNYRDAKAAGMDLGVYFYTYATTPEGVRADAELLISWLQGKQLEYPVYFDLEDPSLAELGKDALTEFCEIFLSVLQENGFYGALYSNQSWLSDYLHQDVLKNVYDIWYARYPTNSTDSVSPSASFSWNTDKYGVQLGLWQYTQYGTIEGIEDIFFDFNYAYRDYPTLIKQYGYNGYPTQSEATPSNA